MKTSLDPRHLKREKAVKALFSLSFNQNTSFKNELAKKVLSSFKKTDQLISQVASEWPISQINKIDLAILRLAIYELVLEPKEPPKVIIDEAVELGKKYGSENTPSFVNGVLGAILTKKIQFKEKHDK